MQSYAVRIFDKSNDERLAEADRKDGKYVIH